MEVEELVSRAWKAVADAGVPEALQELAFTEALAFLKASRPSGGSGGRGVADTVDASKAPSGQQTEHAGHPSTGRADDSRDVGATPFAKFAHESGVSQEDLERVFYLDEDGLPHLNGPRSRLGKNTADQARAIAVAITAAHDYMRDDTPIAESVVRSEATRLKVDPAGNWSRDMGRLTGVGWVGPTRGKQFKTSGATPEAFGKVFSAILGPPAE